MALALPAFCLDLLSLFYPRPVPLALLALSRVCFSGVSASLAPLHFGVSTQMSPVPTKLVFCSSVTVLSPPVLAVVPSRLLPQESEQQETRGLISLFPPEPQGPAQLWAQRRHSISRLTDY